MFINKKLHLNQKGACMPDTPEIHGFCDERFNSIKELLEENLKSGSDVGASFAMTIKGEFVVDIWGGHADAARTIPWDQDTLVHVFSSTKVMTALCTLMLVDRGLLDLDAPVADYWPEFAQAGKQDIPVRYLLSHTSGLACFEKRISFEAVYDWNHAVRLLAAQKPRWAPGTKNGYHAITFGFLLGELVRRVTGKSLGTFFRDEVAIPLRADFHIGLPKEDDPRVAELIPPKRSLWDKFFLWFITKILGNWLPVRALLNPSLLKIDVTKTRDYRAAEIPAVNGHGNARSIARVGSVLACSGKVGNVRLLSSETIEKALVEQSYCKDLVLRTPIRFGLGFGLTSKEIKIGPNPNVLFWGGAGGSFVAMDVDAKMCCAFAPNKMYIDLSDPLIGDPRIKKSLALIPELYKVIFPD